MQPHEQRVVEEKRALDEKLNKLADFIRTSPVFETLPHMDQGLLFAQQDAMLTYSNILHERIARFPPSN